MALLGNAGQSLGMKVVYLATRLVKWIATRMMANLIVFRDMIMATLSVVQMALGNHMALLGNAGQSLAMKMVF